MISALDTRYDAKTAGLKISKSTDPVDTRHRNSQQPISKYIEKMVVLIGQLKAMNTNIDEAFAVGLLVASIDVSAMKPVVSAVKTLAEA